MKKQFISDNQLPPDDELRTADSILFSQSNFGTQELRREFDAYQEIGIPGELGRNSELPIPFDATLTLKNESQIHPVTIRTAVGKIGCRSGCSNYFEHTDVIDNGFQQ